ncbi:ATP-dependent zinc metalloprotease FTSH 8, mitochondrial [Olea europaea subsp. europaea]|uniref:ATP-dependent zinc metalloprotease FTSH 8, mitochondrial n=1 Tax=Olea europaea subsp. europaea TaxID=158383 RepID=A0A8S0PSS8_OLEEU|nr:ATP-dependent zinc metalloprotease FTSH 8, mitochondrial [Olea europaea subsp. europaea]
MIGEAHSRILSQMVIYCSVIMQLVISLKKRENGSPESLLHLIAQINPIESIAFLTLKASLLCMLASQVFDVMRKREQMLLVELAAEKTNFGAIEAHGEAAKWVKDHRNLYQQAQAKVQMLK